MRYVNNIIALNSILLLELLESNIVGVLFEALTTKTESILADQSMLIGTNATFSGSFSITSGVRKPNFAVNHLARVVEV